MIAKQFRYFGSVVGSYFVAVACCGTLLSQDSDRIFPVNNSAATIAEEMKKYTELIEHSNAKIEMIPIPGGKFAMGCPDSDPNKNPDEVPVHTVELSPFWMAKHENLGCIRCVDVGFGRVLSNG